VCLDFSPPFSLPLADRGEAGPAGKDGPDSTVVELNMLREQRNQITEERNVFRRQLHDYRIAVCTELLPVSQGRTIFISASPLSSTS
jgi:hypothetical protein